MNRFGWVVANQMKLLNYGEGGVRFASTEQQIGIGYSQRQFRIQFVILWINNDPLKMDIASFERGF